MDNHDKNMEDALLSHNSLTRDTSHMLRKLTVEGLAAWQVGWKPTSAKWVLAEKEWGRREREEAAKWQRYSALFGLLGVVVGAALSLVVGLLLK